MEAEASQQRHKQGEDTMPKKGNSSQVGKGKNHDPLDPKNFKQNMQNQPDTHASGRAARIARQNAAEARKRSDSQNSAKSTQSSATATASPAARPRADSGVSQNTQGTYYTAKTFESPSLDSVDSDTSSVFSDDGYESEVVAPSARPHPQAAARAAAQSSDLSPENLARHNQQLEGGATQLSRSGSRASTNSFENMADFLNDDETSSVASDAATFTGNRREETLQHNEQQRREDMGMGNQGNPHQTAEATVVENEDNFQSLLADILYEYAVQPNADFRNVLPPEVKQQINEAYARTEGLDANGTPRKRQAFTKPALERGVEITDFALWNALGVYVMDTEEDRKSSRTQQVAFTGRKVEDDARFERFGANREKVRRNLMHQGAANKVVNKLFPSATSQQREGIVNKMVAVLDDVGDAVFQDVLQDYKYSITDHNKDVARDAKMHPIHEHPVLKKLAIEAAPGVGLNVSHLQPDANNELEKYGLKGQDITLTTGSVTKAFSRSDTLFGQERVLESVGMAVAIKAVNAAVDDLQNELNKDRDLAKSRVSSSEFSMSQLERRKIAEEIVKQMHKAVEKGTQPEEILAKLNALGSFKNLDRNAVDNEPGLGAAYLREMVKSEILENVSHVKQYARAGFTDSVIRDRSYMPFADSLSEKIARNAFTKFVRADYEGQEKGETEKVAAADIKSPGTPAAKAAIRGAMLAEATRIIDGRLIPDIKKGEHHPLRKENGPAIPAPDFDLQSSVRNHMIEQIANDMEARFSHTATVNDFKGACKDGGEVAEYEEKLATNLVRETYTSRNNDVNLKLKFAHFGGYRESKAYKFFSGYAFSGRPLFGEPKSGALDKMVDQTFKDLDKKQIERPYYGRASTNKIIDEAISQAGDMMPTVTAELRAELADALAAELKTIADEGRDLSITEVADALNARGADGKSAMERLAALPQRTDKGAVTLSSITGHKVEGEEQGFFERRAHVYRHIFKDLKDQGIASIPAKVARAQIIEKANEALKGITDERGVAGTIEGMSSKLSDLVDETVSEYLEQNKSRITTELIGQIADGVNKVLLGGGGLNADFSQSKGKMGKNPHLASRSTYGGDVQQLKGAIKERIAIAVSDAAALVQSYTQINVPDSKETRKGKSQEEARRRAQEKVEKQQREREEKEALAAEEEMQQAAAQGEVTLSWFERMAQFFTNRRDQEIASGQGVPLVATNVPSHEAAVLTKLPKSAATEAKNLQATIRRARTASEGASAAKTHAQRESSGTPGRGRGQSM